MQVFHSKIDWWVWGFVISMTGLLAQLLLNMLAKGSLVQNWLFAAVYALTIVVLWWPLWSTRYQLQAKQLVVKCMFLKWRIPLADIQNVKDTDFSSAAPALSFKRIRIDYWQNGKHKFILVSPRKAEIFKASLSAARV
ncbi:PH domain-containing protein [Acinetobacter tianfuensis]|uniref:Uncharacterized protein YyaB-like PH domain-containing protein n=1 Tax=Acinetobacter tianfuensis TaxID=2419603 RepID=A0A3A8EM67_9GAMM|nr:PH domain-containing protein [Acinetobacter tianfuensis]RKG29473.1 hypothetical protein D7V32_14770 [Acinetobacter tianfuensis]